MCKITQKEIHHRIVLQRTDWVGHKIPNSGDAFTKGKSEYCSHAIDFLMGKAELAIRGTKTSSIFCFRTHNTQLSKTIPLKQNFSCFSLLSTK